MANRVKIACVGDIMCGDSFYALGHGVASSVDKYGSEFLPPEIIDVLSGHDVVLGNVECPISDKGRKNHVLRSLHMRGRPESAKYLAQWGITVANVANNHILEQGLEAAMDTVQQLEKSGIKTVGAGKDESFQAGIEATEINCGNQSITVIATCFCDEKYSFNGGGSLNEVLKTIEAEANKDKLVVVSVHWGYELMDRPSLWQRGIKQQFMEAGALMVIGHHPHVVQGIEMRDGQLTAYSLGNFIFDGFYEATCWSIILSVTVVEKKISKWQVIPIIKGKDYRPMLATGTKKDELEKEIARRCNLLIFDIPNKAEYEKEYMLEFKAVNARFRHELWLYLLKRFPFHRPIHWPQILWRPVQRRTGKW